MLFHVLILLLALQEKAPKKPDIVVLDPNGPRQELEAEPTVEYAFNPHQAKREMDVGSFYLKKGSYAAAAARFREAVKWHPRLADAYRKLGEAHHKGGELQKALEAYQKSLEIEPKGKKAREAQKNIALLERELKE